MLRSFCALRNSVTVLAITLVAGGASVSAGELRIDYALTAALPEPGIPAMLKGGAAEPRPEGTPVVARIRAAMATVTVTPRPMPVSAAPPLITNVDPTPAVSAPPPAKAAVGVSAAPVVERPAPAPEAELPPIAPANVAVAAPKPVKVASEGPKLVRLTNLEPSKPAAMPAAPAPGSVASARPTRIARLIPVSTQRPAAVPAPVVTQVQTQALASASAPAPKSGPVPAPSPAPTQAPVAKKFGPELTPAPAVASASVSASVSASPAAVPSAPSPALSAAVDDVDRPVTAEPPKGATESLRDAIVASLKDNPEIQIALARQDDAKYAVDEARAGYLPHLDLSVGWGRELVKSGTTAATHEYRTEATVTMNQNLWDFGVTINDIKRARASYRSAQWATRERIEAISYDITNAYLGVLAQQDLLALTEDQIGVTKKILRIVSVQKDLGLTTPADVGRAQTRLENVQSQLLDRNSALQQSRNAYKRLTNHLPARVVDLPPGGTTLPESADAAVDMIDSHNPKLAQVVQDRRSLDKQYDSQTGAFFPRIGLQLQGNYKNDVMGNTGRADDARAMVTLSYKLFNGGADRAVQRRIGARLREADYELDRVRREVEQDIRIDYEALKAAREKIATIDAEIESAQRVAELYRQQFREGRRTVFDLLDSEQVLFNARANRITNGIAMRAAEYRVMQRLGGLFDLVSGGQELPPLVVPAPGSED